MSENTIDKRAERTGIVPKLFELVPGSQMVIAGKLADIVSTLSVHNDKIIQALEKQFNLPTDQNFIMQRLLEKGFEGQVEFAALNLLAIPVVLGLGKYATDLLNKIDDAELAKQIPLLSPEEARKIPDKCVGMLGLAWLALGTWNGLQQFLFYQNPDLLQKIYNAFGG